MAEYFENRAVGKYFRAQTDKYTGYLRFLGTYLEYRVVEGIPETGCMLEIIDVDKGIVLTRVNNSLFENGRDFIQC